VPGPVSRNSQRGMTLIELLVSMTVTSMLLVALGGVFVNVSSRYQGWADRLANASTGSSLAANLQADSHRYVVCDNLNTLVYTLDLCPALPPGDPTSPSPVPVVRYQVSNSAPYVISRESPVGAPAAFMARSRGTTRPQFRADCHDAGNAVSGHIHVYGLRLDDGDGGANVNRENFMVYYAAPWTAACA
jgi:prepilin-type N-terminal cleavage/methylation domain-containing protein